MGKYRDLLESLQDLRESLVDSKGKEVNPGDTVYYSKLQLGGRKRGGKIRIESIKGNKVTASHWGETRTFSAKGKETFTYDIKDLKGYITLV